MLIPVFVSAPSIGSLNPEQKLAYNAIAATLTDFGLEPRSLGKSDSPDEFPLREVIHLARHCSGAVVLDFSQFTAASGTFKSGSPNEKAATAVAFPTPWNQLEAGILFTLRRPALIFEQTGVSGGIFDEGVSEVFVHRMPTVADLDKKGGSAKQVLLKWQARVRSRYYDWDEKQAQASHGPFNGHERQEGIHHAQTHCRRRVAARTDGIVRTHRSWRDFEPVCRSCTPAVGH